MIRVIDVADKPKVRVPEGHVQNVLDSSKDGTRVHVAIREIDEGQTYRVARSDRTQVLYILEGRDASLTHTTADVAAEHIGQRRSGIYLEPSEEATVTASNGPLVVLLVTVPKHVGKAGAAQSPTGYLFEEGQLRSLIDEKGIRERTFWVNKETGLSGSWDLQLGRMLYAPHGHSPRHVHRASKTSTTTAASRRV